MSKPKRSAKRTRRPVASPPLKKKPAAKKKAPAPAKRKGGAKVSSVDGYVQTLPPLMQTIVNRLRSLVAAASPEAIEAFRWAQPVYEVNGPFAYLKAYKGYVNFGFWRGAALEAPEGLLEGEGTRMRHIQISALADIDDEQLKTLVRQAVLLNTRLGSPTR